MKGKYNMKKLSQLKYGVLLQSAVDVARQDNMPIITVS